MALFSTYKGPLSRLSMIILNVAVACLLVAMLVMLGSFIWTHARLPHGSGEVINWYFNLG